MKACENRRRKRELVAWMLIVSLLAGIWWCNRMVVEAAEYTVTAYFEPNGGVMAWDDGNTTELKSKEYSTTEGSVTIDLPEVTYEGHTFNGWQYHLCDDIYTVQKEMTEVTIVLESDYGITFTAQWTALKTATVSYDLAGGSLDGASTLSSQTYSQANAEEVSYNVELPGEPIREGYIFDGWVCSADSQNYAAGTSVDLSYDNSSVTFTAQWTADDGGDAGGDETSAEEIGTGAVSLEAGKRYRLPQGTWQVEGDPSIYPGGIEFYVSETKTYTISEGG